MPMTESYDQAVRALDDLALQSSKRGKDGMKLAEGLRPAIRYLEEALTRNSLAAVA